MLDALTREQLKKVMGGSGPGSGVNPCGSRAEDIVWCCDTGTTGKCKDFVGNCSYVVGNTDEEKKKCSSNQV